MRSKSHAHSSHNVVGEKKTQENKSRFFWHSFCITSFLIVTYNFRESHIDLRKKNIYKFYSKKCAFHVIKAVCFCLFVQRKIM